MIETPTEIDCARMEFRIGTSADKTKVLLEQRAFKLKEDTEPFSVVTVSLTLTEATALYNGLGRIVAKARSGGLKELFYRIIGLRERY